MENKHENLDFSGKNIESLVGGVKLIRRNTQTKIWPIFTILGFFWILMKHFNRYWATDCVMYVIH